MKRQERIVKVKNDELKDQEEAEDCEAEKQVDKRNFKYEYWTRPVKDYPINDIDLIQLTEEHKTIIKETWEEHIQQHMIVYGVKIFQQIFKLNPRIVKIFQFGQALVDSPDTTTDENIIRHPRQFMESIESAIECLDDMEHKVAPVFLNLGRHHIYFTGLDDRYFDTFSGSMMYVWREMFGPESFTPTVRAAWSRLFDYMLQHLKGGFLQAQQERAQRTEK